MNVMKKLAKVCSCVALVAAVGSGCDYDYDNPADKQRDGGQLEDDSKSTKDRNNDMTTPDWDSSDGYDGRDGHFCDASAFEDRIVAFCRTQYPSPPEHGELGASCVDHEQCDSLFCLQDYNSASDDYCSIHCPNRDECPFGYDCKNTPSGWPRCHKADCDPLFLINGDVSRCITALLSDASEACTYVDCGSQFGELIDCMVAGARFCGDAEEACGVENGLLESCLYL